MESMLVNSDVHGAVAPVNVVSTNGFCNTLSPYTLHVYCNTPINSHKGHLLLSFFKKLGCTLYSWMKGIQESKQLL
jgi:hypothetical protein